MREHDRDEVTPETIEAALSAISPAAAAIDREVLMYQAGYEAARMALTNSERSRSRQTLVRRSTAEASHAASPAGPGRRPRQTRFRFPKLWRVRLREQGTGNVRLWQATTALSTAACLALAALVVHEPPSSLDPPLVRVAPRASDDDREPIADATDVLRSAAEARPASFEASRVERRVQHLIHGAPATNYIALRATMLQQGVDRWHSDIRPPADDLLPARPTGPSTVRSLLEELLPPEPAGDASRDRIPGNASAEDKESIV